MGGKGREQARAGPRLQSLQSECYKHLQKKYLRAHGLSRVNLPRYRRAAKWLRFAKRPSGSPSCSAAGR